jgi:hypothetical protein
MDRNKAGLSQAAADNSLRLQPQRTVDIADKIGDFGGGAVLADNRGGQTGPRFLDPGMEIA